MLNVSCTLCSSCTWVQHDKTSVSVMSVNVNVHVYMLTAASAEALHAVHKAVHLRSPLHHPTLTPLHLSRASQRRLRYSMRSWNIDAHCVAVGKQTTSCFFLFISLARSFSLRLSLSASLPPVVIVVRLTSRWVSLPAKAVLWLWPFGTAAEENQT